MDLGLSGRTALVTGASKGIGLATVRALVAEGVKVAAVARTTNADLAGTGAIVVTADLSTADGVLAGVGGALEAIGDLDILVNNVGGGPPEMMGSFLELTEEAWTVGFDYNFFAAVRAIRLAMPGLLRTKGNIVNVSSIGGRAPVRTPLNYSTPKAALNALGKALNEEFGPQGVRVNTVSPGPTRTYIWEGPTGAALAAAQGIDQATLLAALPEASGMTTGRLIEPAEIAELITFVVSPRGASIAGVDYIVDGGALKGV
ncbi:MAG TPA: SDR family NAD(P)-dependent oxidoreductase [Pseudonocardiaceae bacterium]|jgi:NAD(P)-dependent dehydrogenase (short-subunit alcohol dehydrogenase family)|nr:SDR family NAD(P)-dependent oxidoreductase [Pseudonocardiaceae bacterium]